MVKRPLDRLLTSHVLSGTLLGFEMLVRPFDKYKVSSKPKCVQPLCELQKTRLRKYEEKRIEYLMSLYPRGA